MEQGGYVLTNVNNNSIRIKAVIPRIKISVFNALLIGEGLVLVISILLGHNKTLYVLQKSTHP